MLDLVENFVRELAKDILIGKITTIRPNRLAPNQ